MDFIAVNYKTDEGIIAFVIMFWFIHITVTKRNITRIPYVFLK